MELLLKILTVVGQLGIGAGLMQYYNFRLKRNDQKLNGVESMSKIWKDEFDRLQERIDHLEADNNAKANIITGLQKKIHELEVNVAAKNAIAAMGKDLEKSGQSQSLQKMLEGAFNQEDAAEIQQFIKSKHRKLNKPGHEQD